MGRKAIWYGLAFIVNKKLKNKIYNLGKANDRIPVLQLTRSRGKKQKESDISVEKDDFKPSSRLDSRLETF